MAINYLKNYYEILDVPQDATSQQIKEAHRKQALKYHPDKNIDIDTTDLFRDVQDAYEVLKDNEMRADYDANYQHPSFALFKEIVTRNVSFIEIQDYLKQGASIDAHNACNQTILMYAANHFNSDLVKFLVGHNASINALDCTGNNPLMYASIGEKIGFSIDNAAIIKERNQQSFERKEEPEKNQTNPEQKETENQIDITKAPIMEISVRPNILQVLWKATVEPSLLFNMLMELASSVYYYANGYRIKFTTYSEGQKKDDGMITDQEIISSISDFIFGKNETSDSDHKQNNTDTKRDENKRQIDKAKAQIA
jgi:curved DNA-binding protein CbpA